MNIFILLIGALYACAVVREWLNGNYNLAGVYAAYAVSQFFLSRVSG